MKKRSGGGGKNKSCRSGSTSSSEAEGPDADLSPSDDLPEGTSRDSSFGSRQSSVKRADSKAKTDGELCHVTITTTSTAMSHFFGYPPLLIISCLES